MSAEDRYRLESRIATGGMGEVWRATDTVLNREVAVKLLKHEYADDPTFRGRFEAEARNAASLSHPHIASVFDFGELDRDDGSGSRPYLVMELVRGQPLSALLQRGQPMPSDRAAELLAQAADAIAAAHGVGIVHRDVKPANLLVTPDGTVKITDFGIARATGAAEFTQTGQVIGTAHYLSPEQAEGRQATAASDIYALGVVLYECLAGERPFDKEAPLQIALAHVREEVPPLPDTVPGRMRAIVATALAKDPADRFDSAEEMAAALRGRDVSSLGPALAALGLGAAALAAGGAAAAADGDGAADGAADGEGATRVMPTGGEAAAAGPHRVTTTTTTSGGGSTAGRRGLPPWWPWAAAALLVLVVILATAALAGGGDEPRDTAGGNQRDRTAQPSATPTPEPTPTPQETEPPPEPDPTPTPEEQTIDLDEGDYVGRDAKDVTEELEDMGFDVEEEKVEATSEDQEKDTVAGISPSGPVEPGSEITVEKYEQYKEPKEETDE